MHHPDCGLDSPLIFSAEILYPEPVIVQIGEAQGRIQPDGRIVVSDYLQVSAAGAAFQSPVQNGPADSRGKMPSPAVRMYMDSVDADIFPVQDAESRSHDPAAFVYGGADGFLGDSPVHGRNHHPMHDICGSLQGKESVDPGAGDKGTDVHRSAGLRVTAEFGNNHHIGGMLDNILAVFQPGVEIRRDQRGNLEDARSSPFPVNVLTVGDFFRNRQCRRADLLHAVGPVCIEIRKAQQPAVIYLDLVGRPGVQR